MVYLFILCMLQTFYIFPFYHPFVLLSILYAYGLLYMSFWKIFLSLLLVIPYQSTSLCFYHRYFSHKSFSTSRLMQFVFAWVACVCYQGGPLWWASVHRKHHKCCGSIDDPHSPRHGFYYSWLGWIFVETSIYKNYVKDLLKFPELVYLDRFSYIPSILMFLFLQHTINTDNALSLYVFPSILNNIIALYFNVCFHNLEEKDKCLPIDADISMKIIFKLIYRGHIQYMLYILTKFNGEHLHKTHHKHPRQIKRGEYDLAYYFIITPLLRMNLIYEK